MTPPPFAPVFAKGKSHQHTVVSFATAGNGSPFLACTGTVSGIVTGNHIFVSNADGSFPEYLGKAGVVTGVFINIQMHTQFSRGAGCLVWTPTQVWQSSLPGVGARDVEVNSGVELVETTGRIPLRTKVSEESERVRFTFARCSRFDWATFRIWMRTGPGAGRLGAWTVAYYDPDPALVRCIKVVDAGADRGLRGAQEAYSLRSWVCELGVVSDWSYVV